jgi:hypothetical protein
MAQKVLFANDDDDDDAHERSVQLLAISGSQKYSTIFLLGEYLDYCVIS